jgi:hypothetical protein
MLKSLSIVLSVLLVSEFAVAAQIKMICKNPRRSYVVEFDSKARTFILRNVGDVVRYRVRRMQKHRYGYVVSGKTVKGGPDFVAYFGRNRRIHFMERGKVFQTDKCR